MYFENVSINRTARCSSSLHYPADGRMPETHIANCDDVCEVVMVNGLESETDDNPARDPSLHRVA